MKTQNDLEREFWDEEQHIEATIAFLKLRGLSPPGAPEVSLQAAVKIRYFERKNRDEPLSRSIGAVIYRLKNLQLLAKRVEQLDKN